jgi:osmotically inducible lipoprotein OsmB
MFRSGIKIALVASLVALGGCASKSQTIGAATGAAVGAAVSNGGAIGTVGGAMVGYGLGKAYEERRR